MNVSCPVIETKRNKVNCEDCHAHSHISVKPGYRGKLVVYDAKVTLGDQEFSACPYNAVKDGGGWKGGEHDSNS